MFDLNQCSLFMNRIKIFLSRRGTGILFTLISVTAINCWQQILRNFDNDNAFSIAAAKNISEGHGYSIKTASSADFSKFYYDPLNRWPPGYSWLLVIMHKLFNTDWIHTSFILNAVGLTALVIIFRKMLLQLEYPEWIVNMTVLYFGFLLHPFHYFYYADIFGFLFFLSGLSVLIKGIKSEKNIVSLSILAAFLLGCSDYMKYLYIPLSPLPIISFYFYGYSVKRKDFKTAAAKALVLLVFIIFSLLLFQYFNSGSALYINPSKTGFFPDQLYWIAPVIPYGLVNMLFLNMQLSIVLHVSFIFLHAFWQIVYLFCMGWLAYTGYKLFRLRIPGIRDFRNFYLIQAVLFSVILFSYLLVLSVTKSKHYPDTYFEWVYGQELRYYSVFIVFLIQFIALIFLKQKYLLGKTARLIFRCLVGFILFIEITHGAYYCIKAIAVEKKYGVSVSADQFLYKSMELTKNNLTRNKNLVICSNNSTIANMCSLENAPVFYDLGKLKKPVIHSLPVTLLVAVDTTVPGTFVPMLSHPGVKPDYIFRNVSYYFVNLPKTENF
jgi:hypothetical protein